MQMDANGQSHTVRGGPVDTWGRVRASIERRRAGSDL